LWSPHQLLQSLRSVAAGLRLEPEDSSRSYRKLQPGARDVVTMGREVVVSSDQQGGSFAVPRSQVSRKGMPLDYVFPHARKAHRPVGGRFARVSLVVRVHSLALDSEGEYTRHLSLYIRGGPDAPPPLPQGARPLGSRNIGPTRVFGYETGRALRFR